MATTLIGIFLDTVERHRKPTQFMRKPGGTWESRSAEQALADVERLAMGLRDLGVEPGDHVALLSETRYEWAVADLAILGLGAVTVPLYPTLGGIAPARNLPTRWRRPAPPPGAGRPWRAGAA